MKGIRRWIVPALLAGLQTPAIAAGGPFGIDHSVGVDAAGPWQRRNQVALEYGTLVLVLGSALWEGDATRLGRTDWRAVDSLVIGAVSAQVLKLAFSRARPTQTDSPDAWFKGRGHNSFPSGEVTEVASAITPYVLEYGADHPAVYALELLPLYDAIARVKVHAHWQSDVLAGYLLGTAAGYFAQRRAESLTVSVLPRGVTIGWRKAF